jgi:flagellar hook-associated protein 2
VDGVTDIERDTNDISDVIDGVTLNLAEADPSTTVTVKIGNDTTSITDAIGTFVDAYNAWRSFVAQNQATNSDGTAASGTTLFGDATLRALSTTIDSTLTSYIGTTSLGAIGITVNSDNELNVDSTTLSTALSDNFDAVKKLFSYTADTSSSGLSLVAHGSNATIATFTMNITTDTAGKITGATATDSAGNTTSLAYSGSSITGLAGTAYEGLQFAFTGSQSESIAVSTSQGIADKLYQISSQADDTASGTIQSLIDSIKSQDDDLQSRATTLQTSANTYYNRLLDYYGRLESRISEANQMADLLKELVSYDTGSSS